MVYVTIILIGVWFGALTYMFLADPWTDDNGDWVGFITIGEWIRHRKQFRREQMLDDLAYTAYASCGYCGRDWMYCEHDDLEAWLADNDLGSDN